MEAGSSSIGSGGRIAYVTLNRLLTDGTMPFCVEVVKKIKVTTLSLLLSFLEKREFGGVKND